MSTAPRSEPESGDMKCSPALLVFAWLFVGIPLLWGVTQTLLKSMDLFK